MEALTLLLETPPQSHAYLALPFLAERCIYGASLSAGVNSAGVIVHVQGLCIHTCPTPSEYVLGMGRVILRFCKF